MLLGKLFLLINNLRYNDLELRNFKHRVSFIHNITKTYHVRGTVIDFEIR